MEIGTGVALSKVKIAAIAWGMNILSGIVNTVGTKAVSRMSAFYVWWTLGGTFVLVVTLLVKSPSKVRLPSYGLGCLRKSNNFYSI